MNTRLQMHPGTHPSTSTWDPHESDANVTLLNVITNVGDFRFTFSRFPLFIRTSPDMQLSPYGDQSISCYAVEEQVKFQADKCQHASCTTLRQRSELFVNPPIRRLSDVSNCLQNTHPPSLAPTPPQPSTLPPARAGDGRWTL